MLKKQILLFFAPIILFSILFMCVYFFTKIYIPKVTEREFGTEITYHTEDAGVFQKLDVGGYPYLRSKNFDELPVATILLRAFFIKFNQISESVTPIHFGVYVEKRGSYDWSFKQNKYVKD